MNKPELRVIYLSCGDVIATSGDLWHISGLGDGVMNTFSLKNPAGEECKDKIISESGDPGELSSAKIKGVSSSIPDALTSCYGLWAIDIYGYTDTPQNPFYSYFSPYVPEMNKFAGYYTYDGQDFTWVHN